MFPLNEETPQSHYGDNLATRDTADTERVIIGSPPSSHFTVILQSGWFPQAETPRDIRFVNTSSLRPRLENENGPAGAQVRIGSRSS